MRDRNAQSLQTVTLEAPGDFLSGLLVVSSAQRVMLRSGGICSMPEESGNWHVIAASEGKLRVASSTCSWPLEAGQCAVFDGQEAVSVLAREDAVMDHLVFRGRIADSIFAQCRESGGLFFSRGGEAVSRLLRLFSGASRAVASREASAQAYQLLLTLLDTGSAGPAGQRRFPPVVEAALGIIRSDYAFLDGIAELADRLEISQEYLTRSFLKYTGITPGKYLTQVRIENAKLLLRQGKHSIQFVSDACGFANANYFARVFRRSVGVNPREYSRLRENPSVLPSPDDQLYVL